MKRYNSIVVGAGISGLLSAYMLATHGQSVLIVEKKDRIGNSPSGKNQGIVHSGGLFVEKHSEVISYCQEAQVLFEKFFPNAKIKLKPSLYIVNAKSTHNFFNILSKFGVQVSELKTPLNEYLSLGASRRYRAFEVNELVMDKGIVLEDLFQRARKAKVDFIFTDEVKEILIDKEQRKFLGVRMKDLKVMADKLVLANGLGIKPLLIKLNSRVAEKIRSRLASMLVFKNKSLDRAIITPELNGPVVVPAKGKCLVSTYGTTQPIIDSNEEPDYVYPEIFNEVYQSIDCLNSSLFEHSRYSGYHSTKTDFLDEFTENNVSPMFTVLDHSKLDRIKNIWTVIPGKWTFAFHVAQSVSQQILRRKLNLKELLLNRDHVC